jgi:hypothetical protein
MELFLNRRVFCSSITFSCCTVLAGHCISDAGSNFSLVTQFALPGADRRTWSLLGMIGKCPTQIYGAHVRIIIKLSSATTTFLLQ